MSTFRTTAAAALALTLGLSGAAAAEAPDADPRHDLVNGGTVTVLGGSITGTYSQLIWDMSALLDNGYEFRVLPILGKGSTTAIEDLFYLDGIDVAIVQSDTLDFMVSNNVFPDIRDRIRYVTVLFNEEIHLLAREGIETIQDLEGRKVSFGPSSSGTFMTASIVFARSGIDVEALDLSHQEGLDQLRRGEIDALVRVAGAPVKFLQDVSADDNLHIVPLPPIEGSYLEATVTHEQYPSLVPAGQTVKTLAVGAVMATNNWPADHPRRHRVQALVDQLQGRLGELRRQPFHEKWQQVDFEKELPGWTRWRPVTAEQDDGAEVTIRPAGASR